MKRNVAVETRLHSFSTSAENEDELFVSVHKYTWVMDLGYRLDRKLCWPQGCGEGKNLLLLPEVEDSAVQAEDRSLHWLSYPSSWKVCRVLNRAPSAEKTHGRGSWRREHQQQTVTPCNVVQIFRRKYSLHLQGRSRLIMEGKVPRKHSRPQGHIQDNPSSCNEHQRHFSGG
jgi:hypothetical protein